MVELTQSAILFIWWCVRVKIAIHTREFWRTRAQLLCSHTLTNNPSLYPFWFGLVVAVWDCRWQWWLPPAKNGVLWILHVRIQCKISRWIVWRCSIQWWTKRRHHYHDHGVQKTSTTTLVSRKIIFAFITKVGETFRPHTAMRPMLDLPHRFFP